MTKKTGKKTAKTQGERIYTMPEMMTRADNLEIDVNLLYEAYTRLTKTVSGLEKTLARLTK